MRPFTPAKYGTPTVGSDNNTETPKSSLHKRKGYIVKKGSNDMVKIDIAELESMATHLRRNAHLPVKHLPSNIKRDFRQLLMYVSLLYDSKQYIILHNIISNHFHDLDQIIPGTIGAYCAGCQVETSFTDPLEGCSAICAGSMPPKKDDWSFCSNTVILATYEEDRFIFTISNRSDSKRGRETAFVFVNYTDISDFPGFSTDEKNQLSALGIKYVYLNGYTKNGRDYVGLEKNAINIINIKHREYADIDKHKDTHGFNDSGLVVFLVILVLVALFFAWRYLQLNSYSR